MKQLLFLSLLILASCGPSVKTESSDTMSEKAIVITTIHSPSEHHTELTPTMAGYNSAMGVDYDGNTGIRVGETFQITSTTIPEKFGVAFQCQHGTFTVEGSETKHKILYDKCQKFVGDTMTILYKEMYHVTYQKKNDSLVPFKRELFKMDFIDAQ